MSHSPRRALSINEKHALLMLGAAVVSLALMFTSRNAPWESIAPLLFIFAIVALSGAFALVMEPARKPTLEPIPVRIVKPRRRRGR